MSPERREGTIEALTVLHEAQTAQATRQSEVEPPLLSDPDEAPS